jgi:hypothetical protein
MSLIKLYARTEAYLQLHGLHAFRNIVMYVFADGVAAPHNICISPPIARVPVYTTLQHRHHAIHELHASCKSSVIHDSD